MMRKVAQDVGPSTRWVLLKELDLRGIKVITGAKMKDIAANHVIYTDANGMDVKLETDSVVLAMGARPENSLAKALESSGVELKVIGDANKIGKIGEAIDEGFKLAAEL
jgi:NADH dehydrogenase FAD-containing subunit